MQNYLHHDLLTDLFKMEQQNCTRLLSKDEIKILREVYETATQVCTVVDGIEAEGSTARSWLVKLNRLF